MSDLVKFVLKRIDDEELAARDLMRRAQEAELHLRSPRWLGNIVPGGHGWGEVQLMATRVLAACESKRRIMTLCGADPEKPGGLLLRVQMDAIVRLLAVAYADDSEYLEEWRP